MAAEMIQTNEETKGIERDGRKYTVVQNVGERGIHNLICAIDGLADALDGPMFDNLSELQSPAICGTVQALKILTEELLTALDVLPSVEQTVERVFREPDPEAITLSRQLLEAGYILWEDPVREGSYALSDRRGEMCISCVGLETIRQWVDRH